MRHRAYGGRIDYVHDREGVRGREWFRVTVDEGGQRTVRAQCEMDDSDLLRDVVQTVDGAWRPRDCFVRLTRAGRFLGAGLFLFGEDAIECEATSDEAGRVSQRIATPGRVRLFASHPLVTDGWQTAAFDHASDEAVQTVTPWATPSPLPDGGSVPMAAVGSKVIEYRGDERVEVPAGTFECRHYRLHPSNPANPPLEAWVFGEDAQLARLRWDLLECDYVLAQYEAQG